MRKEIVTIENIKKDIRAQLWRNVIGGMLCLPWLWLIALLIGKLFELCGRTVPYIVIHLVTLAIVLLDITLLLIKLYQVRNERFTFVRDFVVDKIGKVPYILSRGTFYRYKPYRLVFAREGTMPIRQNMDFYKWTGCPRSDKTIFDMADMKDMFLLVQIGRKTWVMYNEKFFDTSVVDGEKVNT